MSYLVATALALNLNIYDVASPETDINIRCLKPGFYVFLLGYPKEVPLSVKLLNPIYQEHGCFYLANLPFALYQLDSALGVINPVAKVGLFGVDSPGYYTVRFQTPNKTKVGFLEFANSYPEIYELDKGQTLKFRMHMDAGDRMLFCILSESNKQKATLKLIDPRGKVITESKVAAPLGLVPILPSVSGEYYFVLTSDSQGSYIIIKENLTDLLQE